MRNLTVKDMIEAALETGILTEIPASGSTIRFNRMESMWIQRHLAKKLEANARPNDPIDEWDGRKFCKLHGLDEPHGLPIYVRAGNE